MPDSDHPNPLAAIGLSAAEATAYELLVARSPAAPPDLDALWDRPEPLADVLAALESRDLVCRTAAGYVAQPPDVALDVLLLAEEQQHRAARAHADALAGAYQGVAHVPDSTVERVTGPLAVHQRLAAICRSAHRDLRWLARPGACQDQDEVAATTLRLMARGVSCRTVYERGMLDETGARDRVDRVTAAGAQVRVARALPTALYLADDRMALLPFGRDEALVAYPGSILDAFDALFEALWTSAVPTQGAPMDAGLVEILLTGDTDAAVARQLGVGHRTVARRIADLMDQLGAHTRFQAGVQAAFRDFAHPDQL